MATRLSKEQVDELCARFVRGETQADLAVAFGIGERTVTRHLKRRGVDQKSREVMAAGGPVGQSLAPAQAASFYTELGDPPDDPLGGVEWLRKALIASAQQALVDPVFAGAEALRRKELREIASAVGRVITPAAMYDAKNLINADSEDLEKTKAGPEQVPRAEV